MIKNILTNLKIEQLNAMQEAAIDTWKEGKDLILLSPTGSGKTLAYLLPLLQSLKPDAKGVQAIVLVPSRELAFRLDASFYRQKIVAIIILQIFGGQCLGW